MKDQKRKFIEALRHRAALPDHAAEPRLGRGGTMLLAAIADYLEGTAPEYPYTNWFQHLHLYLTDAFKEFRSSDRWADLRRRYEEEAKSHVPDLVNMHVGGVHRLLVVTELARVMPVLAEQESWLTTHLESYFNAQQNVVNQAWHRFVRVAYQEMIRRVNGERHRGNKGWFNTTTLMTYSMAGRCTFTFSRADGSDITYIADESDEHGLRAGPNYTRTPYARCVEMIDDVASLWNIDRMMSNELVSLV